MSIDFKHSPYLTYRPDIDGMRAIAVAAVIIFHAFPEFLPGGFAGVDIFFVISGFLITSILIKNKKDATGYLDFYSRRVNRIFPSLIIVLIFGLFMGWFFLLPDEFSQLGKHVVAGASFVSNLVLRREAGYFDASSEIKPLLNLWSLGIEEQFYLIWPIIFWVAYKFKVRPILGILVIFLVSFYLMINSSAQDNVGTFLYPQTRVWELAAGGILAYSSYIYGNADTGIINFSVFSDNFYTGLRNSISAIGLALIFYALVKINSDSDVYPGLMTIIPVLGTILIIAGGADVWVNKFLLSNRALVWLGLISFPLYLWHWPIFVFMRIIDGGEPTHLMYMISILAALICAFITYRYIEVPLRCIKSQGAKTCWLIGAISIVALIGFIVLNYQGFPNRSSIKDDVALNEELRWTFWDDESCVAKFHMHPCQITSGTPRVMIIGDSHANHLFPGVKAHMRDRSIGVLSIGSIFPAKDVKITPIKNLNHFPSGESNYLAENLKILDKNPTIDVVVISAFWRPVLSGEILNKAERRYWGGTQVKSSIPEENGYDREEIVYRGIKRTINELQNRHKNIFLVRDTPDFQNNIKTICFKRFSNQKAVNCSVKRSSIEARRTEENHFFERISKEFPQISIIDPYKYFCDADLCYLTIGSKPLYRDAQHLSVYGSEFLINSLAKDTHHVSILKSDILRK